MSDPGPCAVEMVLVLVVACLCVCCVCVSFSLFFFPTSLRSGGLEHLHRYPEGGESVCVRGGGWEKNPDQAERALVSSSSCKNLRS